METMLRSLGDEKRCEIIRLIWSRELPATKIAEHFPDVTRPAISQHLAVLRRAGLISERREGTRRLYVVNRSELDRLRSFLDSFWTSSLETLRDLAEINEKVKGIK